ncbi:MAG: TonB-dependent receptor [Deltaproteobacteria bacterium]|nr:TonB-dependent receptor [Deltaproteobacteria bacterium]
MKRLVLPAILFAAATAHAQDATIITDVEVPTVVIEQTDAATGESDDDLDLANIVQSAAKGVTTVQEAPAIVTVVTADEIRDRQFQNIQDLYSTVPGWNSASLAFNTFPVPLVRGQVQAVQFLHDGLSLFDPYVNVSTTSRVQPMELVKRVEMITGPGGVLWGSNSLLGILNIITKDAEDIEGVEVGGQVGDGRGDRLMGRAYVMAGKSDMLGGKLKGFFHGSFETYDGAAQKFPQLLFHSALPQPNSPNVYGPLVTSDQPRSMLVSLNGKLTYGDLQLRVSFPFGARYNPVGLSGNPNLEAQAEDFRCPMGETDPSCADARFLSRKNRQDTFDRYAVAEYRTRFAKGKAGITARGYLQQFVRGFDPLQVLTASGLLQGGLSFAVDLTAYRVGTGIDGDIELSKKVRLLYGAEAFNEFKIDNVTQSRQGQGTQSKLPAPYDINRLPLLCPRTTDPATGNLVPIADCPLTFGFPADRTVLGLYANPQYRPNKKLIFDLGARVQVAPEALGTLSYPVKTTVAGTVVWAFIPNWHAKFNYAQGFRPPVFNNTITNGEAVNITGDPDLKVETSDSAQVEVNARIFKGQRRIRELAFRIDGSYTRLQNLIQIFSGAYTNTPQREIASGEFLGKLYIQGGHRLELGYTYLKVATEDKGLYRSLPEHQFTLGSVFTLVANKLSATSTLRVMGTAEDPNRLVEYRGSVFNDRGEPMTPLEVNSADMVMDRLPPIADLSVGLLYMPTSKLTVKASVYNVLVGHFYQPDVNYDFEPHLEYLASPYEGFRAYLSAMYQY